MNINKNKPLIITGFLTLSVLTLIGYVLLNFEKLTGAKTVEVVSPEIPVKEQAVSEIENTDPAGETSINKETKEPSNIENVSEKSKEEKTESADTDISIINGYVSWGYQIASGRKIDTIIIHSSYNALGGDPYDLDKLLAEYKQYSAAPHYLIDRRGKIYRLVSESNIAYHAGESQTPDGRANVNNFSIGIELMNTEDDKSTDSQYNSLNKLLKNLKSRYNVKYILGHNQIAPGRKTDPWNLDWKLVR